LSCNNPDFKKTNIKQQLLSAIHLGNNLKIGAKMPQQAALRL
jgi:hypothetical protein